MVSLALVALFLTPSPSRSGAEVHFQATPQFIGGCDVDRVKRAVLTYRYAGP